MNSLRLKNERKFLVEEENLPLLAALISADFDGSVKVSDIYFDSDEYSLTKDGLRNLSYGETLRLRGFGNPELSSGVQLELKRRVGQAVFKTTAKMSLEDAYDYIYGGNFPEKASSDFAEIDYFVTLKQLKPKMLLTFDRSFATDYKNGLTFVADSGIKGRFDRLEFDGGAEERRSGAATVSVKTDGRPIPAEIIGILEKFTVPPVGKGKDAARAELLLAAKTA